MIRRMQAEDVTKVAQNEAVCFSMPWSEDAFRDVLTKKDCIYLVAVCEGDIVGHCGVMNILGEGEITNVAVHPSYRGRGYGKRLIEVLLLEGEENGIQDFTLEVRKGNASAIHIYEAAGFRAEGIRPGFYDNPKEDAIIMWKRQEE